MTRRWLRLILSTVASLALVVTAPGLGFYQAAAQLNFTAPTPTGIMPGLAGAPIQGLHELDTSLNGTALSNLGHGIDLMSLKALEKGRGDFEILSKESDGSSVRTSRARNSATAGRLADQGTKVIRTFTNMVEGLKNFANVEVGDAGHNYQVGQKLQDALTGEVSFVAEELLAVDLPVSLGSAFQKTGVEGRPVTRGGHVATSLNATSLNAQRDHYRSSGNSFRNVSIAVAVASLAAGTWYAYNGVLNPVWTLPIWLLIVAISQGGVVTEWTGLPRLIFKAILAFTTGVEIIGLFKLFAYYGILPL